MVEKLIELLNNQEKYLDELFILLEVQYNMIMKKDVYGLESIVSKVEEKGKQIAQVEVERRNFMGKESLAEFVNNSDNDELKAAYKKIKNTANKVVDKKDTNEMILKQNIIFNNKMLNMMNPNREIKTYNSFGGYKNK